TLAKLVSQANGRIIIMPGSGVRAENIKALAEKTGAVEFHSSARKQQESKMEFKREEMKENLVSVALDVEEAGKITQHLQSM
ncbi:MAG: copper homeostasis protein CutC, partial [Chitinophagaceae bacterium]